MEILLRRLLGLYLVVSALAFVPTAFLYFGVENSSGPWWILPAIPLAQDIVFPPVESLLQLLGVYFIVEGLGAAVRPGLEMLLFTESWWARVGSFAAAAVWLVAGWVLVSRPEIVLKAFSKQPTA